MDSSLRTKYAIWKEHVTKGIQHPGGISRYCRECGLTVSAFYYWRKRFKEKNSIS